MLLQSCARVFYLVCREFTKNIDRSRETAYKVNNLRRDSRAAVRTFTPNFHGGGWLQVNGSAEIVSLSVALGTPVYLQRQVYGEHESWPEFRERMVREK